MANPKVVKTVKTTPSSKSKTNQSPDNKGKKSAVKPKPSKSSNKKKKASSSSNSTFQKMMKGDGQMIWERVNFMYMLAGLVVIAIGYLLMLGGEMPSPDVWEPERIYSFRRITLAPIVILIGLGIEVYAIFAK